MCVLLVRKNLKVGTGRWRDVREFMGIRFIEKLKANQKLSSMDSTIIESLIPFTHFCEPIIY